MGFLYNKKILVLDDSKVTLDYLKDLLLPEGAKLYCYSELNEEILRENYDLVISDIIVNKENSFAFLQKLRNSQPKLKVILHSALPETHEALRERKDFFDGFIKKPVEKNKIFLLLENYLEAPLRGKKVLILEDARVSLQAMEKILTSLGAKVFSFSEINEKEILKENYDLAVLDLHIGNKTALSLIPQLKIHNPSVIILVVSSFPQTLMGEPIAESLVSYILQKPVTDKEFRRIVWEIFQKPKIGERRKEKRFQKNLTCWIARYEKTLSKAELFESPFVVDLSLSGMSFQSFFEYSKDEELIIWFLGKNRNVDLIELHGLIRWRRDPEKGVQKIYSYGVEYIKDKSVGYAKYCEILPISQ